MPQKEKTEHILFISDCVPPFLSGSTIVMHRLLLQFPENSYTFLTRSIKGESKERVDEKLRLSGRYIYVLNSYLWKFFPKVQSRDSKWKWLQVPIIFVRGMQVLRGKTKKHLLVAPFAHSGTFLLAACLLHCITKIPLSIYFFDLFDRGQRNNWENRMRSKIERMAISMASNVFVMSEPLQEHYGKKYRIKPILLPHPVDISSCNSSCDTENDRVKQSGGSLKIVFAGMIYEAQLDAMLNLVSVVNELPDVEFHIYSPITESKRRWMGITGSQVVFHGSVPHNEIPVVLQNADILFLPMAFECVYPQMVKKIPTDKLREQLAAGRKIIETASPSKLPEYLAASRPILIHAPSYSYIARYGKEHKCAAVVDQPDLGMLRKAIFRMRYDLDYRNYLIENAKKAVVQHDVFRVSRVLQQHLGIIT